MKGQGQKLWSDLVFFIKFDNICNNGIWPYKEHELFFYKSMKIIYSIKHWYLFQWKRDFSFQTVEGLFQKSLVLDIFIGSLCCAYHFVSTAYTNLSYWKNSHFRCLKSMQINICIYILPIFIFHIFHNIAWLFFTLIYYYTVWIWFVFLRI